MMKKFAVLALILAFMACEKEPTMPTDTALIGTIWKVDSVANVKDGVRTSGVITSPDFINVSYGNTQYVITSNSSTPITKNYEKSGSLLYSWDVGASKAPNLFATIVTLTATKMTLREDLSNGTYFTYMTAK